MYSGYLLLLLSLLLLAVYGTEESKRRIVSYLRFVGETKFEKLKMRTKYIYSTQTNTHTNHSRGIIMKSLVPTHRITTFRPSVNFSATSVEPEQKARLMDVYLCG